MERRAMFRFALAVVLIANLLFGVSCSETPEGTLLAQARSEYNKGHKLMRAGKFDQALVHFNKALQHLDDKDACLSLKAGCLLALGKREKAWEVSRSPYIDRGVLADGYYYIEALIQLRFKGSKGARSLDDFVSLRRDIEVCTGVLQVDESLNRFSAMRASAWSNHSNLTH